MSTGRVDFFVCSSPLEILTAHVIAQQYSIPGGAAAVLAVEGPPDPRVIEPAIWNDFLVLKDSRPRLADWKRRFAQNLSAMRALRARHSASSATLLVSNLYWLMNNSVVADTFKRQDSGDKWDLALFDQGLVLYSQTRLGIPELVETPRSLAKYLMLRANGFPAMLVTPWNADVRHPLVRRIYCWHPRLLKTSKQVIPLDVRFVQGLVARQLPEAVPLDHEACLYLSQPIYKFIGDALFRPIVDRLRDELVSRGFVRLYYKPHHHDDQAWRKYLEDDLGFLPITGYEQLPAELVAMALKPRLVAGHTSSALMNIAAWLEDVRILAFGTRMIDRLGTFAAHPPIYPSIVACYENFSNIEIRD